MKIEIVQYILRWCVRNEHLKILKFLIKHGANIHAPTPKFKNERN